MTMTREVAFALLDNMKNKATEQEASAIEFILKNNTNNTDVDNVVNVVYNKEQTKKYMIEKYGLDITSNYVDNLFRRKGFPSKRIGKMLYVEPNKLDNYLTKEKII